MNVNHEEPRYKVRLNKLAHGFCRFIFKDIPMELIEIIINYLLISMQFYEDKLGDNMEVDVKNNSVKMSDVVNDWSSIAFGKEPISIKICNQFRIKFLWKHKTISFFMGFIMTSNIETCSFDWNESVGTDDKSFGILIHSWAKKLDVFTKNMRGIKGFDKESYIASKAFGENQTFQLLFDFVESKVMIFHEDKMTHCINDIELNDIIPAISMYRENEEIQVLEYEFV